MPAHISRSPAETQKIAQDFGQTLKPGDIVALIGELGAGKTTFIQGLVKSLGVKAYATSPSFVIINEYQGKFPVYHVDLYRLPEVPQIEDLGIEEYFARGDGVVLIEWAERLKELLPSKYIEVKMEIIGDQERRISITRVGMRNRGK